MATSIDQIQQTIESFAARVSQCDAPFHGEPTADELLALIRMTTETFTCDPTLHLRDDPDSDWPYIAVEVSLTGSAKDALPKVREWHHRLAVELRPTTQYALATRFD
jgi:hypothetical protein